MNPGQLFWTNIVSRIAGAMLKSLGENMFKYKHKIKLFFSLKPIDSDIGIAEYRVV
jgi:hypothetical protein